jgi:adenine deaminase
MRSKGWRAAALLAAAILAAPAEPRERAKAAAAADMVYRDGYVYTVDAHDSVQTALAIRAGRIVYVGGDAGLAPFTGPKTTVIDLHGRMFAQP